MVIDVPDMSALATVNVPPLLTVTAPASAPAAPPDTPSVSPPADTVVPPL